MHILKLSEQGAFVDLSLEDSTYGVLQVKSQSEISTQNNASFYHITKEKPSLENQGRQRDIHTSTSPQYESNLKGIYYGIALHFAMEQKLKLQLNDALLLEILNNKVGFYLDFKELEKIVARCNLILKIKILLKL